MRGEELEMSEIKKELARYLWAMFVTVLSSQATMVVDAAVGGNLLGADAVSAVDLVMPVNELFYALVMMLGMGACTVSSMCLGRGDVGAVRRHFTAAIVSSLLVMLLMGAGIWVLRDRIVEFLCGDSYLREFTGDYLVALVPFFIINGLSIIFMIFTSMAGRPMLMMCCAIVQFALNVSLNFLLIKLLGMGIEALAYSSAISCAVSVLLLLPYCLRKDCPFRMLRCAFRELVPALGENIRYGVGFFVVDMAYVLMAYAMNSLILNFSGERGLYLWSVVLMIYLAACFASSSAQETSLMLGGRLFGCGRKVEARMVYNRSVLFVLGWMALILVAVFAFPRFALPLFGAAQVDLYPELLRVIACAAPFVVGVILGNLFLVRLVQRGKIVKYIVFSCLMYLAVPLGYYCFILA